MPTSACTVILQHDSANEDESTMERYLDVLGNMNTAFTVVFTVECILKIFAYGFKVRFSFGFKMRFLCGFKERF